MPVRRTARHLEKNLPDYTGKRPGSVMNCAAGISRSCYKKQKSNIKLNSQKGYSRLQMAKSKSLIYR